MGIMIESELIPMFERNLMVRKRVKGDIAIINATIDAPAEKMEKENKLSITKLLFIITLFELIFLGTGRVLNIYGITLREIFFLLNFYIFFTFLFLKRKFFFSSLVKISVIFVFLNFFIWGLLLALVRNNSLYYAFADSNGILYLLYILPWTSFAFYENWSRRFVINTFLIFIFLFSIVVNSAVIFSLFGYLNLYQIGSYLSNTLHFQLISGIMPGGFPRIIWVQFIFFIPATLFFTSRLISRKNFSFLKLIMLLSCLLALVFSYSRGLWLGLIVGLIFLFLISRKTVKAKNIIIIVVIFLFCLVVIGLLNFNYLTLIGERILLSFNMQEISNAIRFSQAEFLLTEWMKYPVFGKGYGATVEGLVRSEIAPYSFELEPIALLMKLGLIGIILWIFYFIFLIYESKRQIRNNKEDWIFRAIYSSIPAIIVASSTNPYLLNSVGMGIIALFILVLTINKIKVSYEKN